MDIGPDFFNDNLSIAMGTETLLTHDMVPEGLSAVSSIVRRGVLVRPTGTVPNQGSQLAVPVPVPWWRWLKEAGKMNSAT
jgi:hypothetical protein